MTPNEMTKCGGGCGNVGLRMRCYDSEQYQHKKYEYVNVISQYDERRARS
jgi:hypothetical protein